MFDLVHRVGPGAETRGGLPHDSQPRGVVCRGDEQEPLRRFAQAPVPVQEPPFHSLGEGQLRRQWLPARQLFATEDVGQLDERKWVAPGADDQLVADRRVDVAGRVCPQQGVRSLSADSLESDRRQVVAREPARGAVAGGEQECDTLGLQAPGHEEQCGR